MGLSIGESASWKVCVDAHVSCRRSADEQREVTWSPYVAGLSKRDLLKDVVLAQFGMLVLVHSKFVTLMMFFTRPSSEE